MANLKGNHAHDTSNQPLAHNVNAFAVMVALYDFNAAEEPEISMKKGEPMEMLDMDPALNGWAYGRKKRDGVEGYVPVSYLCAQHSAGDRGMSHHSHTHGHGHNHN